MEGEWVVYAFSLFLCFLWLLYGYVKDRFFKEEKPKTQYFCPAVEDRIPLNAHGESEIVWKDGKSAYGYSCTVCGSVHVYDLGIAPAPIYVGDNITITIEK